MDIQSEKGVRRILAIGVLFAAIGILALVIALMQPMPENKGERLAREIFATTTEEKARVLQAVHASDRSGEEISEEEKLRVLESLRVESQ